MIPANNETTPMNPLTTSDESSESIGQTKKSQVIDRVFMQIGIEKLFVDVPENTGQPHYDAENGRQPLILHIDDDEDLVDVLSMRLENCGFRVANALDGVEGMQSALAYPADCIVLDYDMPNMRGDEVIKQLKSNLQTAEIPVVVLTAIHKKSLKRRMLSMGADVFMTKPFEFNQLHAEILELISPVKGSNLTSI